MNAVEQKLVYDKAEAAQVLHISISSLNRSIAARRLRCVRIGTRVLIAHTAIMDLLQADAPGRR